MSPNDAVIVTAHALERFTHRVLREHHPRNEDRSVISREVRDAIAEGRVAKTQPRHVADKHYHRNRHKARHSTRYVWPENADYAYLVVSRPNGIIVTTVIG